MKQPRLAQETGAEELFGRSIDELTAKQAIKTALEIQQQPRKWLELATALERKADEIVAFLKEPFAQEDLLVVFAGAGSSAFAGGIIAAEVMASAHRSAAAIPTTHLVDNHQCYLAPNRPILLVSLARSGDSPESVAATEIVDRHARKVWHVVLTCNARGRLARSASTPDRLCLIMPEGTNDAGFAMTSSFSSMVLAALAIFASADIAGGAHRIRGASELARSLLARHRWIEELAEKRHGRVVYLGSGQLYPAAAECALKLLELTDGEMIALGDSPLGFRHGPKTIIDKDTLVIGLANRSPHAQKYCRDMLLEIHRDGNAEVVALTPETSNGLAAIATPPIGLSGADLTDGWLSVLHVMFGQLFGLFKSLHLGHTPDDPCPSGEVNRVVRSVTIYDPP